MKLLGAILFCICLGVAGQLLLKYGVGTPDAAAVLTSYLRIFSSPVVIIGMFCYMASSLLWLLILQRAHLSYVYPMISLGYVLVVLACLILFHEPVSVLRWTGLGVICVGVTLVTRS